MATVEEGAIFEFCENRYRELDVIDGGYYPSKHDGLVRREAAVRFDISEDEVDRIYHDYSLHVADIEMKKVMKLSPEKRRAVRIQKAKDIMLYNRDLPFYKTEGPPRTKMNNPLDVIGDEYGALVETIAQAGWTIPLSVDIKRFTELKDMINDIAKIELFFLNYYHGREFRLQCRKTRQTNDSDTQKAIFDECIASYQNGLYSACLTTLITVFEGFISLFNNDPNNLRVMHICNDKGKIEAGKGNKIKSLCWLSMYEYVKILYQKSDFSQPEPNATNRHWVLHGRTEKTATQVDCLQLFNALSTLASIRKHWEQYSLAENHV